MLRFFTAGESHGPALVGIVEGLPAGLPVPPEAVDRDLARRQQGPGRGGRMQIEHDHIAFLGGVRGGLTLGGPVAFTIANRDYAHWRAAMDPVAADMAQRVTQPRPGHADLAGALKYGFDDVRNVLERSSARETAARVAAGALARQLLAQFGITVMSQVIAIGAVKAAPQPIAAAVQAEHMPLRCADAAAGQKMLAAIEEARRCGDTLGGVFEVIATGVPVGLGSYVQWDRRLDARLAGALMSIPAVKGVEVGDGFAAAARPGSQVHDPIFYDPERSYYRPTNHAGGLEGGMSNGEPIVVRCAMKPIPTLARPLPSVDMASKQPVMAAVERSDVCAVPAAAVVGEAMMCLVLAEALREKYGGDSLAEMQRHWQAGKNLKKD